VKFWIDECLTPMLVGQAHSPGLVVLPQRPRAAQLPLFGNAITHITRRATSASEAPSDWMLNRVVEIEDESEACRDMLIPASKP
jgi:hypothetical protein